MSDADAREKCSTMNPLNNADAVVVDACILISIASKEQDTSPIAEQAFEVYVNNGWEFFAPSVIVAEGMFALCHKLQSGVLTQTEHDQAVEYFLDYMTIIETPTDESALMKRAVEIRGNYVCKRSSDGLYIAFAEELSKSRITELLTFDKAMRNQVANYTPAITLNLLQI